MRILLVNDDGIESESLILLARALKDRHTVTVVAPDSERSAAGHCYTFHLPLSLKRVTAPVWEGITAYKTNGSPCDCTMLGLGAATDGQVDLVVSGINAGANIGTDIPASGTVNAALEAAMRGVPALALSQEIPFLTPAKGDYTPWFARAAEMSARLIDTLDCTQLAGYIWSVNYPQTEEIRGVKACPMGVSRNDFSYLPQKDHVGREHYWVACERTEKDINRQNQTDDFWLSQGYITITPMRADFTARDLIDSVQQTAQEIPFLKK